MSEFLNKIPDMNKLFKTSSSKEIKQALELFLNPEFLESSPSNGETDNSSKSAVDVVLEELNK